MESGKEFSLAKEAVHLLVDPNQKDGVVSARKY
jgi:hypothetical protein